MNTIRHALLIAATLVYASVSSADTRQLLNGKDLTRWKHVGSGRFVVEAGLLRPEGGVGLPWFDAEKVGNAVIHVVYKVNSRNDNSGVFFRIPDPPEDPWMPVRLEFIILS